MFLAHQHELRQAHIQGVPLEGVNTLPDTPEGTTDDSDAIVPDEDEVGYPHMLANLIATKLPVSTLRAMLVGILSP